MVSCYLLCLASLAVAGQAMTLNSRGLIGRSDDACSLCEFTVDLRCKGIRSDRGAPYHRIQDCLLPLYGLIKMAADKSNTDNTKVCAITWLVNYENLNLEQFLIGMSGAKWHKIIDERDSCTEHLEYHAVNRTKIQMATDDFVANLGNDKKMIQAYPINLTWNLHLLQQDAQSMFATGDPQIVIINRKHMSGAGRSFRPFAFEGLRDSMRSQVGLPVTTYTGKESVLDTVKLFQQAAGVVGYHGAAWANTYFTSRPHCNVQISTFYDFENKVPWRVSDEMMFNPSGSWYFYFLPLIMMLDANHVPHDAYLARDEMDHFIKDLDWIPLRGVDIADMTSHMVECIKDPKAYNRSHPNPVSVNSTQGLNINSVPSSVARYIPPDRQFSSARDNCTGCDVTVDLRCHGSRASRHQYFNRLAHCLLPMYEMIQLAREAGSNNSAHVCAITWSGTDGKSDGIDLKPFLTDLVDVKWYKFIDERSQQVHCSLYHAANRTHELGATETYLKTFGDDRNLIRSYPIDLKVNLGWMQKDAVNIAGPPSPNFIVLQNTKFGMFPPEALQLIRTKMTKFFQWPLSLYYGTESVQDTVKLFTNTGGIFGYYGSSWANGLFASYPHCNVQYSTFRDFENKSKWYVNDISVWNPLGTMYFVHLPLNQLLEGNNYTMDDYMKAKDKDVIGKLKWIPLTYEDFIKGASWMYPCWQNKYVAYHNIQDKWGKTGNNLEVGSR